MGRGEFGVWQGHVKVQKGKGDGAAAAVSDFFLDLPLLFFVEGGGVRDGRLRRSSTCIVGNKEDTN